MKSCVNFRQYGVIIGQTYTCVYNASVTRGVPVNHSAGACPRVSSAVMLAFREE